MNKHLQVSVIKSIVRIVGCVLAIIFANTPVVGIILIALFFIIAELLGVVEELVDTRK